MIILENRGPTKRTQKDYSLSFELQLVEEVELGHLIKYFYQKITTIFSNKVSKLTSIMCSAEASVEISFRFSTIKALFNRFKNWLKCFCYLDNSYE